MILDLSSGHRNIWFNRLYPDAIFVDLRPEMAPNVVCDTCCLPFMDNFFDMVVFDPPHMTHGKNSKMAIQYTSMTAEEIKRLVRSTSDEAFRVTKQSGFMAFKWNDHDVRLDHTLPLMEGWEPLFGHNFKNRAVQRSRTYWILLKKKRSVYQDEAQMRLILQMERKDEL